jgi:Trk K+ transport system NAD-binding subunit
LDILIVSVRGIGKNHLALAIAHGVHVVISDRNDVRCNEILEHHDVLAVAGDAPAHETYLSTLEDVGNRGGTCPR